MDHLHQIGPVGPPENYMLEGYSMLSAVAARTSTINLGLLVGGVTYRNPALVAKLATTLDIISGGRAVLGIGAAWFEEEHKAYGFDYPSLKERFERLEEALQIFRLMFKEDVATFEGKHFRVDGAFNNPKPIRGDIPILIGGSGERKTLRFVAKYGDGCNLFGDVERVKHLLGVLEGHCEDVGRDSSEITKTRMAHGLHRAQRRRRGGEVREGRWRRPPTPTAPARQAFVGDPDTVAAQAQEYLDAGLDGITITMPDSYDVEMVKLAGETLGRGDRDSHRVTPERGAADRRDPQPRPAQPRDHLRLLAAGGRDGHAREANWCTFATWASRQAGRTIRGEDAIGFIQEWLGRERSLLHPLESLGRWLLRRGLFDPTSKLGAADEALAHAVRRGRAGVATPSRAAT